MASQQPTWIDRIFNSTIGLPQQVIWRLMRALRGDSSLFSERGLLDKALIPGFGIFDSHEQSVMPDEMVESFSDLFDVPLSPGLGSELSVAILSDPLTYLTGGLSAAGKLAKGATAASRIPSVSRILQASAKAADPKRLGRGAAPRNMFLPQAAQESLSPGARHYKTSEELASQITGKDMLRLLDDAEGYLMRGKGARARGKSLVPGVTSVDKYDDAKRLLEVQEISKARKLLEGMDETQAARKLFELTHKSGHRQLALGLPILSNFGMKVNIPTAHQSWWQLYKGQKTKFLDKTKVLSEATGVAAVTRLIGGLPGIRQGVASYNQFKGGMEIGAEALTKASPGVAHLIRPGLAEDFIGPEIPLIGPPIPDELLGKLPGLTDDPQQVMHWASHNQGGSISFQLAQGDTQKFVQSFQERFAEISKQVDTSTPQKLSIGEEEAVNRAFLETFGHLSNDSKETSKHIWARLTGRSVEDINDADFAFPKTFEEMQAALGPTLNRAVDNGKRARQYARAEQYDTKLSRSKIGERSDELSKAREGLGNLGESLAEFAFDAGTNLKRLQNYMFKTGTGIRHGEEAMGDFLASAARGHEQVAALGKHLYVGLKKAIEGKVTKEWGLEEKDVVLLVENLIEMDFLPEELASAFSLGKVNPSNALDTMASQEAAKQRMISSMQSLSARLESWIAKKGGDAPAVLKEMHARVKQEIIDYIPNNKDIADVRTGRRVIAQAIYGKPTYAPLTPIQKRQMEAPWNSHTLTIGGAEHAGKQIGYLSDSEVVKLQQELSSKATREMRHDELSALVDINPTIAKFKKEHGLSNEEVIQLFRTPTGKGNFRYVKRPAIGPYPDVPLPLWDEVPTPKTGEAKLADVLGEDVVREQAGWVSKGDVPTWELSKASVTLDQFGIELGRNTGSIHDITNKPGFAVRYPASHPKSQALGGGKLATETYATLDELMNAQLKHLSAKGSAEKWAKRRFISESWQADVPNIKHPGSVKIPMAAVTRLRKALGKEDLELSRLLKGRAARTVKDPVSGKKTRPGPRRGALIEDPEHLISDAERGDWEALRRVQERRKASKGKKDYEDDYEAQVQQKEIAPESIEAPAPLRAKREMRRDPEGNPIRDKDGVIQYDQPGAVYKNMLPKSETGEYQEGLPFAEGADVAAEVQKYDKVKVPETVTTKRTALGADEEIEHFAHALGRATHAHTNLEEFLKIQEAKGIVNPRVPVELLDSMGDSLNAMSTHVKDIVLNNLPPEIADLFTALQKVNLSTFRAAKRSGVLVAGHPIGYVGRYFTNASRLRIEKVIGSMARDDERTKAIAQRLTTSHPNQFARNLDNYTIEDINDIYKELHDLRMKEATPAINDFYNEITDILKQEGYKPKGVGFHNYKPGATAWADDSLAHDPIQSVLVRLGHAQQEGSIEGYITNFLSGSKSAKGDSYALGGKIVAILDDAENPIEVSRPRVVSEVILDKAVGRPQEPRLARTKTQGVSVAKSIDEVIREETPRWIMLEDETGGMHKIPFAAMDGTGFGILALGKAGDEATLGYKPTVAKSFTAATVRSDLDRSFVRDQGLLGQTLEENLDLVDQHVIFGSENIVLAGARTVADTLEMTGPGMRAFDSINYLVKSFQTVFRVPFQVANMVSGAFQMHMAGVSPKNMVAAYADTFRLLNSDTNWIKTHDSLLAMLDVDGFTSTGVRAMPHLDIVQAARRMGGAEFDRLTPQQVRDLKLDKSEDLVLNLSGGQQVHMGDFLRKAGEMQLFGTFATSLTRGSRTIPESLIRLKLDTLGQSGSVPGQRLLEAGIKKIGARPGELRETTEAINRTATAIGLMREGHSMENAIQITRNAHVPYEKLTPFERNKLKRAITYYTFPRHYVPWAHGKFMEDPTKMAALTQTIRNERLMTTQEGRPALVLGDYRLDAGRLNANMEASMFVAAFADMFAHPLGKTLGIGAGETYPFDPNILSHQVSDMGLTAFGGIFGNLTGSPRILPQGSRSQGQVSNSWEEARKMIWPLKAAFGMMKFANGNIDLANPSKDEKSPFVDYTPMESFISNTDYGLGVRKVRPKHELMNAYYEMRSVHRKLKLRMAATEDESKRAKLQENAQLLSNTLQGMRVDAEQRYFKSKD